MWKFCMLTIFHPESMTKIQLTQPSRERRNIIHSGEKNWNTKRSDLNKDSQQISVRVGKELGIFFMDFPILIQSCTVMREKKSVVALIGVTDACVPTQL